eukprot:jgi/Psemu1/23608/gm1.23608_g
MKLGTAITGAKKNDHQAEMGRSIPKIISVSPCEEGTFQSKQIQANNEISNSSGVTPTANNSSMLKREQPTSLTDENHGFEPNAFAKSLRRHYRKQVRCTKKNAINNPDTIPSTRNTKITRETRSFGTLAMEERLPYESEDEAPRWIAMNA